MTAGGHDDPGMAKHSSGETMPVNGASRPLSDTTDATPTADAPLRRNTAERKLVTVLFADIVGSSSLIAGRDPEDADDLLRSVLERLSASVERYGGTVSQVMGDGILAVFGAPAALEDHALRACLTAQEILSATVRGVADPTLPSVQLRIGIASGEVVAQIVESNMWADYRMVGECVHVAAKLQQCAPPGGALLTGKTLELVPIGVTARPAGAFQLGAQTPPVPIFLLESAHATRRNAMTLLSSAAAPFVGRRPELEILLSALRKAANGRGSLTVLTGEAGIGKSRLVGELARSSAAAGFRLVPWPQAPIHRLGDPDDLEAVAQSLATLAMGLTGGLDKDDDKGDKDGAALVIAAARHGGDLAETAVRELFGERPTDPVWRSIDPAQRADFAIEGLIAAITDLSLNHPLLILVEDAHWVGNLTERLLTALARAVDGRRICVLVTKRPQALTGWKAPDHVRRITLEPLDATQIEQFLDHWLGDHSSLAELKARVAAQSQGMPLYLEESLHALTSAGAIIGTPGDYRLGNASAMLELPASIHGLLAARIDSLHGAARRTLLTAAVIGPSIDEALLRQLAPVPEAMLPATLTELEQAGFLGRGRLLPSPEYVFRHALIQEVAYGTIVRRERKDLHARILRALCGRHDHDLPRRIDLMAHHASMAENWQAAYVYGRRAGQKAESRSKLLDAVANYERALAAVERLKPTRRNTLRRIDLSIALPRALLPRGLTGVHDHLNRARDLAASCGDPIRHARSSSMLASFLWAFAQLDEATRLCREGLAALDQRDDHDTRVQLLLRLGGILADKGLFLQAGDALGRGEALMPPAYPFRRYGLAPIAAVHSHSVMGRSLAELGQTPEALRKALAAVDIAEESGHAFSKVYAKAHLGWTLLIAGQAEPAMPALEDALTLCRAIRSTLWKPLILGGLGHASVLLGNHERGFALFAQSFETFQRQGIGTNRLHPRVSLPQVQVWHAEALLTSGRAAKALAAAKEALATAEESTQLVYQARALAIMGKAATMTGAGHGDALATLRRARDLARHLSMAVLAEHCARRLEALWQAPALTPYP